MDLVDVGHRATAFGEIADAFHRTVRESCVYRMRMNANLAFHDGQWLNIFAKPTTCKSGRRTTMRTRAATKADITIAAGS